MARIVYAINRDLINFKFKTNSTTSFNFVPEVYSFKNTTKRTAIYKKYFNKTHTRNELVL